MLAKLKSRLLVAEKTYEIVFALDKILKFEPGQYVTMVLPGLKSDPRGNGRIFSLVNSPSDNKIAKIIFRNTGSPYKSYLLKMVPGESVQIGSPIGQFNPPKNPIGPVIFLAGGIGIAPFMSILPYPATMFYINTSHQTAPYLDRLPKNTVLVFSDRGEKLDLNMIQTRVKDWCRARYFLAGPPRFVEDLEEQLIHAGLNPGNVVREAFDGED